MKKKFWQNEEVVFLIISVILGLIIYGKIIWLDPISTRDDPWILSPLYHLQSIGDFLNFYLYVESPDVQPIRDLSLLLDIKINQLFGLKTFHLQNGIIWLGLWWFIYKSLRKYYLDRRTNILIILIFLCSPLATSSVGWISARKHLLAALFGVIALTNYFENKKINIRTYFFYILSVLSQPIFILFPAWLALDSIIRSYQSFKKNWKSYLLFNILMFGFMILNFQYYKAYYIRAQEGQKIENLSVDFLNPFVEMMMKLGHYIYLLFLPHNLSIYYNYNSMISFVGIVLLFLFGYISWKLLNWKKTLSIVTLLLLPLVIPITKIQIFLANDTYLLIPMVILCVWSCYVVENVKIENKVKVASLVLILIISVVMSVQELDQWYSAEKLWKKNFELNPNCESSAAYALVLFKNKNNVKAKEISNFHFQNRCIIVNQSYRLYLLNIYLQEHLSIVEKIRLASGFSQTSFGKLTLATLYIKDSQADKALEMLNQLSKIDTQTLRVNIPDEFKAIFYNFCQSSSKEVCFFAKKNIL